jgi:hypothetical protein
MRPLLLLPLLVLLAPAEEEPEGRGRGSGNPEISAGELLAHVKRLSADEWKGRESGGPEEILATDYVAERFRAAGLEPAGEGGTFFQPVPFTVGIREEPGGVFALAAGGPALEPGVDFRALSASASGELEAPLVFAGYGISSAELRYDDYEGLDVKGRIVVLFRHSPHAEGAWAAPGTLLRHAPFIAKIRNAEERGAAAVVVVNDPWSLRGRPDELHSGDIGGGTAKIPCLHMTLRGAAGFLLRAFEGTAEELEGMIHAGGAPQPASRPSEMRARIRVKVAPVEMSGRNVCGLLRAGAEGGKPDEVIVLGAHHDHVGVGKFGSLAQGPAEFGRIHNGADDNASGTAAILELADHFASRRGTLRRSILFLTFTGEERGLLGSAHFVEHPTVPRDRWIAMINMDMVGRLFAQSLFVGGVGTSPAFRPILERRAAELGVKVVFGEGGLAPSDNTSFYRKGVPVLFLFSGMHEDYHRPGDDWEKIDAEGMRKSAALCGAVAADLADLPGKPEFRRADRGGMGPPQPYLGISGGAHPRGVRVEGVAEQSPAAAAGLLAGDVLLSVGGEPTPDIAALRKALASRKPGEAVPLEVLRGGEVLPLSATLGER